MSQELSATGDHLMSQGRVEEALEHYAQAAKYEGEVFRSLPKDSLRTRGIVARSWASLLYKARKYREVRETVQELQRQDFHEAWHEQLRDLDSEAERAQAVFTFPSRIAQEAARRAIRSLRDIVGVLLERFGGKSVWFFLLEGDRLIASITHNTGSEGLDLELTEGIVGYVARTKRGYCAEDVSKDPYYVAWETDTESELAVPIITQKDELLGVLSLESNAKGTFSSPQIAQLQSSVGELIPHILILQNIRKGEPTEATKKRGVYSLKDLRGFPTSDPGAFGWHFRHGWSMSQVLGDFCLHIAEQLAIAQEASIAEEASDRPPRPTCTIWHLDRAKQELYARATAGFDYEYLSARALPVDSTTGWVSRNCDRGHVLRCDWRRRKDFVRGDKAQQMGLSRLVATPIFQPGAKEATGAFNIYFYSEEGDVTDTLVVHIAETIGRMIARHESIRARVAAEYIADRLVRHSVPSVSRFEVIKETLCECLETNGCSVFVRHPERNQLVCVSTTGLERDGRIVTDLSEVVYDLGEPHDGLTGFLGNNPGASLRKNDLPNPDEQGPWLPEARVKSKFRETSSLSETEHRRFLGISLPDDDGTVLAVLRLNRPAAWKPFLESDEIMLRELAAVCKETLRSWGIEPTVKQYIKAATLRLIPEPHEQQPNVVDALGRLLRPVQSHGGATSIQVDELLQNILAIFKEQRALHASLREVVGLDGDQQFRLFAYHSTRSKGPPDECRHKPVRRSEGSLAWTCVAKRKVLTFDRKESGELFKPIHEDSKRVVEGVCIPLITWSANTCVTWAFSLDFEDAVAWRSETIEVLLFAARKLSAILGGTAPVVLRPPFDFLKEFVASAHRDAGADASRVVLRLGDTETSTTVVEINEPSIPSRTGMSAQPKPEEIQRFWEQADEFGVKVLEGQLAVEYHIPLRFGPFQVGELISSFPSRRDEQFDWIKLRRTLESWSSFTGLVEGDRLAWKTGFEPRDDQEISGVRVWDERLAWYPPEEVLEPIQARLRDAASA